MDQNLPPIRTEMHEVLLIRLLSLFSKQNKKEKKRSQHHEVLHVVVIAAILRKIFISCRHPSM